MGASGSVGDTVRGGGFSSWWDLVREKQKRLNRARNPPSRGGNSTLLCKLTGRHGGPGLCKFVSFLFKQAASLYTVPSQISRRFLSSSREILIFFPPFLLSHLEGFRFAQKRTGVLSLRHVRHHAQRKHIARSLTHSRMHSHAHLVESVRDRKSAVSHVRNRREVLSLPFSLSTPAPRGRPRGFETLRPRHSDSLCFLLSPKGHAIVSS